MNYLLILGIAFFCLTPIIFNLSATAYTENVDDSAQNLESTFPPIKNIQSFEADTIPPNLEITNFNPCNPLFTNGTVTVQGIASDNDKVKLVEGLIHTGPLTEDFHYANAIPISENDWSRWSIPLTIANDQQHRILVHAYDYSGNEEWAESLVNTERAKMNSEAVTDKSGTTHIAFVDSTFTNGAYNKDSFYFFYKKYYGAPADQKITTDLDLLTGEIPLEFDHEYFQSILDRVKESVPDSVVSIIGDEEVHFGSIFKKDGTNAYDALILLHTEYATQTSYDNLIKFLNNGGSIVLLDGNNFYARIQFDPELCTVTLIKGHEWEFDGKAAKPGVTEGFMEDNTKWFGSNYIVNALQDKVIFENNPFNYTHFEENYVTNPRAEILLDYKVKFAQTPTSTEPSSPFLLGGVLKKEPSVEYSDEGKTIATYELASGNGKVIHLGLYGQNLDSNPAFLNYLEKIILPRALNKTVPVESDFEVSDLYWLLPGGDVSNVKLDAESKTLSVNAGFTPDENLKESYLTIVIPKKVMDATEDNKMVNFVVTVNGTPVPYEESSDDIERGLKIRVTGNSEIKIIGTSAIPEFGASMIILIMSVGILFLFSKTNLKYKFSLFKL